MMRKNFRHDRPGVALALVLLVLLAVGALSTAATVITSNAVLINSYDEQQSALEVAVDAGLAEARSRLNSYPGLYPDTGYVTIETGDTIRDAGGNIIPGVSRRIYAGPTGSTTGQYGVFGSIVAVAADATGDRVVRRLEIVQESFAKYAYFTNFEPSNISFGSGDQLFGPIHSNDDIKIYASGATFHGHVTTAEQVVAEDDETAIFLQGFTEGAPAIPMPATADLDRLQGYATQGNMAFVSSAVEDSSQAPMRIEFVARDLNGDGDVTDRNEGFIRVYEVNDPDDSWYVTATLPPDYATRLDWGAPRARLSRSRNCGHISSADTVHAYFSTALEHDLPNNLDWPDTYGPDDNAVDAVNGGVCFLGGAEPLSATDLFEDTTTTPTESWTGRSEPVGQWIPWPDTVSLAIIEASEQGTGGSANTDSLYLFPITRALNPNFKGVIHVTGDVAVSGVVRGHVTLAATGDIIIADDLTYATQPGAPARNCTDDDDANDDILGLFAGGNVVIADNTINAPAVPYDGFDYQTFDPDRGTEENVHATVLALNIFTVDNFSSGSTNDEYCGTTRRGRGCLFLTGGIIQTRRGAVGTEGGTGSLKRYSYDQCAADSPPPYFPTTGHFVRGRVFEVDPVGFDIDEYLALLTSGT